MKFKILQQVEPRYESNYPKVELDAVLRLGLHERAIARSRSRTKRLGLGQLF